MPLPFVVAAVVKVGVGAAARVIARQAATAAAKKAAAAAARKAAEEAAKKAAAEGLKRQAAEAAAKAAARRAAQESLKKAAAKGGSKGRGNTAGKHEGKKDKSRKGPCDHLKKGNAQGRGDYRGGSYGGTKKSGVESHHAPASSSSPLRKSQGPSVQMEPPDHWDTSSHGRNGTAGVRYRKAIADLVAKGKWREAMAAEIKDIRRIANEADDSRKYNEAISEMLKYFKCLENNKLLPMPK